MNIALLNDSFPPFIDGVANAVVNYATILTKDGDFTPVVTPDCPNVDDSEYPFPVLRYAAFDTRETLGYMAGAPFSPTVIKALSEGNIELLHSHCPIASNLLARGLKAKLNVPLVMTYHSRFDIEAQKSIRSKLVQESAIAALVSNIEASDEVWTVSDGAGKSLQSLGFKGDYVVMPNGVDIPKGRMPESEYMEAVSSFKLDLPGNVPVFLFVGRIMWYKGLRIILDALAAIAEAGVDFRAVFIGGGGDKDEVEHYVRDLHLGRKIFFTGPVYDRSILTAWYCRADLFLFPSTYDTNGLVVRESAACGLPTVLIRESCAAEGIEDGRTGFLISENAASLAVLLMKLIGSGREPEAGEAFAGQNLLKKVGFCAQDDIYVSWEDAVHHARKRYETVIENYRRGYYPSPVTPSTEFFRLTGGLMELLAHAKELRDASLEKMASSIAYGKQLGRDVAETLRDDFDRYI